MTRALLYTLCLWLTGCGLLYKNKFEGPGVKIYSNQDVQFVQDVGHKSLRICHEYQRLFNLSSKDIGTIRIILSGNSQSKDQSESTLGFYMGEFNYINIGTNVENVRKEPLLSEVLLHEIAHHFLITDYPDIVNKAWLNEGLAGVFEVTQFEDWNFEYPLFNPVLYEIVRSKNRDGAFKAILTLDWSDFHRQGTKEDNYAVAWSIAYYMIQNAFDRSLPLGDRIKMLYCLDNDELIKYEKEWQSYLRLFNEDKFLMDYAIDSMHYPLTASWAVREIARLREKVNKN